MKLGWTGQANMARAFILPSALAVLAFMYLHSLTAKAQDSDASGQSYYEKTKPILDNPLPDILSATPELQGLEPAGNQDELPSILEKTGMEIEELVGSMPNLISREHVTQTKPGDRGGVRDQRQCEFDYMIVVHWNGRDGTVEEYRSEGKETGPELESPHESYMLTSGFASEWLHFLPSNQAKERFRYLGQQNDGGLRCYVVAFAQVPGLATITGTIKYRGKAIILLSQGIVWIDEASLRIVRMRTDLLAPHPEIGLQSQTTELQFGKTNLPQAATPLWLPQEVVVTTQMNNRVYRNVHRYSDYRVFKVESRILPAPPDPPTPQRSN